MIVESSSSCTGMTSPFRPTGRASLPSPNTPRGTRTFDSPLPAVLPPPPSTNRAKAFDNLFCLACLSFSNRFSFSIKDLDREEVDEGVRDTEGSDEVVLREDT